MSAQISTATREHLARADGAVRRAGVSPASLDASRDHARGAEALVARFAREAATPRVLDAWAEGVAAILESQLEHFPETIYWDIDHMAAALLRGPAGEDAGAMRALCEAIVAIQSQYGRHSVICFRYTHDFTYGFDWAKWVARAPEARAHVGPFDLEFVSYLRQRGDELVELIANDDVKYPKLPDGRPRNPFGFAREPTHERALFAALARRDLLPVRAWDADAAPVWARPFATLREELARELCIPTRHAPRRGRGDAACS